MSSQKRSKNDSVNDTKEMKKPKQDESSSSDKSSDEEMESSSDGESSDEEMDADEVQIDLSGFELAPEDHNGIVQLLQRLFLKNPVDLNEMTHHLIEHQLNVGSVIKESEIDQTTSTGTDEDDTVYGLISVVSLKPDKDLKFVDQLRSMFLELANEHATEQTKKLMNSIFSTATNIVGLILNERYLNLPLSISKPSFTKLKTEIEAESKENTRFNFTHYIIVSKLYKIPPQKKKRSNDQELQTVWCNAEEELFDKLADARFEYAVQGDCDSGLSGKWTKHDVELLPFRRVLVFKADKLTDLITELSKCT